ncbi:hypothetical protein QAD02_018049 [Eretmocerus hayati]|uniref:Uncharacterized protein n=1 Tax=Eretmocerus hayati TaxID=131215 RepID=A0ACC2PIM1_9HYME|nr:hypothetical protein QAD02_018049 [Eretmocerus hayati]
MEAHAATFLDQHRILGIDLRTHKLKRLRHGIYRVDEYNGKEEEVPTSKDFLALPLLPESTSTRPGLVEQEYEEILEYLASNFRAFCGIDVESIDALMELNVKNRSPHLRKTLNSNLSRSSGINGSILDRNRLESDSASHCQKGHYDRGNIYRFAALKVHPYHNQYLRVRVHAALSKSKEQEVIERLLGCSTQDFDKRLLLAPSLLREWGIPFEMLVQHSHDSIYIHKEKHQLVNAGQCITERVPNRSITKPVNTNHHCKACGCNTYGRTVHVIDNPDSSMSVRAVSMKRYVHEATGHAATPSNLKCLVTHENNHTHTAYSCSVCQKSFAKANSLRRHAKIHLPCEETREECPACKKSILKTYMPVHRVTCRSTSLTCQHCKKTFARAGGLTLHISKCSQRT